LTAETYARLEVRRATATDLDAVLSTLAEAARWMVRQNVEGWTPEGFSRRRIAYLIEGGEMYLATLGGEPVGTFALQWDDAQTWGRRALWLLAPDPADVKCSVGWPSMLQPLPFSWPAALSSFAALRFPGCVARFLG